MTCVWPRVFGGICTSKCCTEMRKNRYFTESVRLQASTLTSTLLEIFQCRFRISPGGRGPLMQALFVKMFVKTKELGPVGGVRRKFLHVDLPMYFPHFKILRILRTALRPQLLPYSLLRCLIKRTKITFMNVFSFVQGITSDAFIFFHQMTEGVLGC